VPIVVAVVVRRRFCLGSRYVQGTSRQSVSGLCFLLWNNLPGLWEVGGFALVSVGLRKGF